MKSVRNVFAVLAALIALGCHRSRVATTVCSGGTLGLESRDHRGGGVEVADVLPGGPAAIAGLREGDVILQIGERRITLGCEAEALAFSRDCAPVRIIVQRDGSSIEKTVTPAEQSSFYREACDAGNATGCFRVALLASGEDSIRVLMDEACERGSAEACATRGYRLMMEKSPEAVPVLDRACSAGSGAACAHLAYAYAEGQLMPRDEIRALELYTRGCNLGDALGCYSMGLFHDKGRGTTPNQARAVVAYEQACNAGVAMACTNLGFLVERGSGVIADPARAAALYQRGCQPASCEPPNLRGCVNLGDAYRDGIGVPQDYARAAEIFRTACATEGTDEVAARQRACVLFAGLQFSGLGIPKDVDTAFRASSEGCEKGDAYGCFNVGVIHEDRGNAVLASTFYGRACDGGDSEGCFELGMLYRDAAGVPFDPDRAAELFRKACDGGFEKGCDQY